MTCLLILSLSWYLVGWFSLLWSLWIRFGSGLSVHVVHEPAGFVIVCLVYPLRGPLALLPGIVGRP